MGISPSQYRNNIKNTNSIIQENKDNKQIENLKRIIEQKEMEINELKKFVNNNYIDALNEDL